MISISPFSRDRLADLCRAPPHAQPGRGCGAGVAEDHPQEEASSAPECDARRTVWRLRAVAAAIVQLGPALYFNFLSGAQGISRADAEIEAESLWMLQAPSQAVRLSHGVRTAGVLFFSWEAQYASTVAAYVHTFPLFLDPLTQQRCA